MYFSITDFNYWASFILPFIFLFKLSGKLAFEIYINFQSHSSIYLHKKQYEEDNHRC